MSFGGGGSGGGGTTTTIQAAQPYAPAEPGLNQILSEAGTIYGQGPSAAGYVAPNTQTLQGLAAQETMAGAANTQLMNTIQGNYSNPFLSPMIANAATDVYSNVAGQFSGAGRTPGSPLSQSAVVDQVAQKAMPYAFQSYNAERQRQLQTAQQVPSLTAVGGALEDIQSQQQLAPQMALQQYYNTVAPIAYGLPTQQQTQQNPRANPLGTAAGGAMMGASFGSMVGGPGGAMMGGAIGGLGGLLGGLL
tara:strand:+ start:80 stop:823 length:744 start_codon:yes stop_codon:yes gene_type:complete